MTASEKQSFLINSKQYLHMIFMSSTTLHKIISNTLFEKNDCRKFTPNSGPHKNILTHQQIFFTVIRISSLKIFVRGYNILNFSLKFTLYSF